MSKTADPQTMSRKASVMHRSLSGPIQRVRMDEEAENDVHRYEFKASSDSPVEMWRGFYEILDHKPESVRMDWLNSGNAPMLGMHNRYDQVGVIESARIEGGHIVVTVRVSRSQSDLIQDIEDGIVRNVSIGYRIHKDTLEGRETDEDGNVISTTVRTIDWEPNEVSFVSIPADKSVGLGRSEAEQEEVRARVMELEERFTETEEAKTAEAENQRSNKENTSMDKEPKTKTTVVDEPKRAADQVTAERERISAINKLATRSKEQGLGDHAETAQSFIDSGRSVSAFQSHVLENIEKSPALSQRDLNISDSEAERYDLTKIINGLTRGDMRGCEREMEISDELKERTGKSNDRISIPMDVLMRSYTPKDQRQRDLISVGLTGGGQTDTAKNIVDNELLDQMFIESLREESPVLGLGVTMLSGLTGDVTIPKELVNPEFYWVDEDEEPTEGTYGLGNIELNFKTLAGRVPFTRQALKQSTPNLEFLLTRSLRRGVAIAAEQALINGAGTATVPEGILNASGIGSVSAATLTKSALLELEEAVAAANGDPSSAMLLTNYRGKRRLLETEASSGSGIFLGSREGQDIMTDIGRVVCTNNVPANLGAGTDRSAIIYGNFRSLLVAMWGGLEISRDTSTKAATGGVVLRVFQDMDAKVSRAEEFAAITDLQ